MACTDAFDYDNGDWVSCLGALLGVDGNMTASPLS